MKQKIEDALNFAHEKHFGQTRNITSRAYFDHCTKVMELVSNVTDNENIIVASILHDTLEDTDTTHSELKKIFGKEVADLVQEVTKPYDTLHSKEALMIKFADMLHNSSEQPSKKWIKKRVKMVKDAEKGEFRV